MLGKLAGAWLGEKIAGPNKGAKGAIIGYGAAALARRSVPALAALALGGWAFRKWRDRRRANPPILRRLRLPRLSRLLETGLDLALELERHRLAEAVAALARDDANQPSEMQYSRTLVFSWPLNVIPTPRQSSASSKYGAARIEREPVGRDVC